MELTENFHLNEFESKDGAEMPCEVKINLKELAINLQVLREDLGVPISITSGYRSPAYNKLVGGVKDSQHVLGNAGDIVVGGFTPKEIGVRINELIKEGKMKDGGLGVYKTFVHYDIGRKGRRW